MTPAAAPLPKPKRAPTLYVIVGIKLFKGLVALLLALGFYHLTDNHLPTEFKNLLVALHLDPEKKFFMELARIVGNITPANLAWAAVGAVFYGAFLLLQSVGLACRVSWAVWLVIGESAFFVPIELYELVRHASWFIFFVLAVNVFIVWYLFANRERIIKHHHP